MNLRRGIIAGLAWAMFGVVAVVVGVVLSTFERRVGWEFGIPWWRLYPGIVLIPMLLFFTGLVTYTPQRYVSFVKNLLLLIVLMIPLAVVIGFIFKLLGFIPMHQLKGDDPSYIAQTLQYLLPLLAVSTYLINQRIHPLYALTRLSQDEQLTNL